MASRAPHSNLLTSRWTVRAGLFVFALGAVWALQLVADARGFVEAEGLMIDRDLRTEYGRVAVVPVVEFEHMNGETIRFEAEEEPLVADPEMRLARGPVRVWYDPDSPQAATLHNPSERLISPAFVSASGLSLLVASVWARRRQSRSPVE